MFAVIFLNFFVITQSFDWELSSKYHYFTKRIVPDLYTGGLLTTRQIQYLSTIGFGSIISIADNNETMTEFNGISGEFLSNLDEVRYAKQLGMDASTFHISYNTESLFMISSAILHMKKPIYFHCYVSHFFILLLLFFFFHSIPLKNNHFFYYLEWLYCYFIYTITFISFWYC